MFVSCVDLGKGTKTNPSKKEIFASMAEQNGYVDYGVINGKTDIKLFSNR